MIDFSIEDYTFAIGDVVKFKVYNKKKLNTEPIISKTITVEEETSNIEIVLTSEETKLGKLSNNPMEYWYEVELNGNQTIVGYDEDGAKRIILYPEGADIT